MSVKVRIPSPLRTYTKGVDTVEVEGANVGEVLNSLKAQAAGIETRLFKGPNQLNRFVNVYLNEEDIRFLQNLETPVKAGDEISIVPAIAGGVDLAVRIPSPIRAFVDGAAVVKVRGSTVGEALEDLVAHSDGLAAKLFDSQKQLIRSLNVYLNQEDVRHMKNLATPLKEGDELSIVTAVAGG
jgi:molybdopterin synthase sulfur carrier subunit